MKRNIVCFEIVVLLAGEMCVTGVSFNTYVNRYRLSHACYLLENTDCPIVECVYESGFASLRSFNRIFREQLQKTPIRYRKDIKKAFAPTQ